MERIARRKHAEGVRSGSPKLKIGLFVGSK
jgi:hypothetical protein